MDDTLPPQPKYCTCLYTIPGTFDARSSVSTDYMDGSKRPRIPDPFCVYDHGAAV